MSSLTIHNLDDELKARLRLQAAQHGRSMEHEALEILRLAVLAPSSDLGLAKRIHQRFAALDVQELPIPKRRKFGKSTRSPW
ncbi:MAG: plasmid stabilization protein [Sulfuritalea sp.]|jgi:plasmid stability protein|nr:plasmid stabilization protein [Sulfuritalea sp.]MBK9350594.1 plasmid stabilization protein [Sulfuritalea sp.]